MTNTKNAVVSAKTTKKAPDDKSITIVDKNGRTLVYEPLDLLSETRLMAICGERAQNGPLYSIYSIAASIREVDGVPFPLPTIFSQLEAAVTRLGEGLEAVATALVEQNQADEQAALKNS